MTLATQGASGAAATNVEYGNSGTRVHAMLLTKNLHKRKQHERVSFCFLSSPFLLPLFFFFFSFPLGCGGTPFLDMTFLFLTLIASLLNGGQLHRLMVGKRPDFFSLEVVHLSGFNQGIQQHAVLPFSGRVHSFEMDVCWGAPVQTALR